MNLFLKISAVATMAVIVIAGISMAYYFGIFLPEKETVQMEQQRQEQLTKEQKEQEVQVEAKRTELSKQALRNACLATAELDYITWGKTLSGKSKECSQLTGGARTGCQEAYVEAFAQNDLSLQQDKDNCFKQYPQ